MIERKDECLHRYSQRQLKETPKCSVRSYATRSTAVFVGVEAALNANQQKQRTFWPGSCAKSSIHNRFQEALLKCLTIINKTAQLLCLIFGKPRPIQRIVLGIWPWQIDLTREATSSAFAIMTAHFPLATRVINRSNALSAAVGSICSVRKSRRFRDWEQLHQAIHDARHTSRNAQGDRDLNSLRRVLIERRNEFQQALDRNAERAARRAAQRQQQRDPDENERQDDDGEGRHERDPRRDDAPVKNGRGNPDNDPDGNNPPDAAPPEPEVHRREAAQAPVIFNVWQTNGPSTGTGGQNTTTHDGQDTESNMPWTSARIFSRARMPTTLALPWLGLGYFSLVWFFLAYAWSALVVTPLSSTFICSRFLLGKYSSICGPWGDSPGLTSKPLLPQPSTGLFSDSLKRSPSLICHPSETRHRPLRHRTTWNSVNFPSIERLQACSTHIRIFLRPLSQALVQLAGPKFQARITKDTNIDGAVAQLRSATEVDFESLDGILHDLSQAISE
ncbi:hypothetical protein NM208_g10206 [Fusarium decemcellulare]|uniref:Uncharacterized protein n=1 Tax=Fusarium decemcellulare TaxID=57161 RepID=A0ACC1RYV1_9HYPO|nr:hypothetical protein NM208_g10206 [Fusarium decemcellulare]